MALTIPRAELIGVFLESAAYGIYLTIFSQCLLVLRKRARRPNDYLLGTAVTLFILITLHLIIDILRNVEAFTDDMSTPDYPEMYYGKFNTWQDILKSGLYVGVTLVSDAFILYRSYIVWGRSYLVTLFPLLLLLADAAIGVLWVYTLSEVTELRADVFSDTLSIRVKTFYAITLAMNVICTVLIAYKIWSIQHAVSPFSQGIGKDNVLSQVSAIVIESGSFYSAMLIVMIGTYSTGSPAMFMFLNSMSPIIVSIASVCTLQPTTNRALSHFVSPSHAGHRLSSVIVRVGMGVSHGDRSARPRGHSGSSVRHPWSQTAGGASLGRRPASGHADELYSFPNGGVQVTLQQTVHTHIDVSRESDEAIDPDSKHMVV
ncbi:hypothetical protein CONPUDRAFT_138116 [Coniophora puteana RWD-64-598 SS2]|uniref:Uncharacterized protein n=1 Tax=Coniophora puteana (strain RWD-64-598) TaxID=741705 RepID=A0A5M3MM03_CONPW|nr:uncharacterized protein CONPUDRAFT_138116 [Coniophora puteana RWD-64-598 SS2]EIW80040.1 hypothetical protein CONPUDRAFT_138116 [Coniophora puteana RWD-64-598 SS2]